MPILGRYIVRTVLGYTALTMLVLLALGALFLFIGQQDDIGTGTLHGEPGDAVRDAEPAELRRSSCCRSRR